jgi:predicted RNA-binding protein with PIN domain
MEAVMSQEQQESIDLVKYGALWQKVQEMDKKVDKMERQLEQLLELANKSKGGFWLGMTIVSFVSVIIGYIISIFKAH